MMTEYSSSYAWRAFLSVSAYSYSILIGNPIARWTKNKGFQYN